jgi:hypothetical protein
MIYCTDITIANKIGKSACSAKSHILDIDEAMALVNAVVS